MDTTITVPMVLNPHGIETTFLNCGGGQRGRFLFL